MGTRLEVRARLTVFLRSPVCSEQRLVDVLRRHFDSRKNGPYVSGVLSNTVYDENAFNKA